MGVSQNIMRALYAVMRPDHLKFASYGPVSHLNNSSNKLVDQYVKINFHYLVVSTSKLTSCSCVYTKIGD